jgi:hypothetical protein
LPEKAVALFRLNSVSVITAFGETVETAPATASADPDLVRAEMLFPTILLLLMRTRAANRSAAPEHTRKASLPTGILGDVERAVAVTRLLLTVLSDMVKEPPSPVENPDPHHTPLPRSFDPEMTLPLISVPRMDAVAPDSRQMPAQFALTSTDGGIETTISVRFALTALLRIASAPPST